MSKWLECDDSSVNLGQGVKIVFWEAEDRGGGAGGGVAEEEKEEVVVVT